MHYYLPTTYAYNRRDYVLGTSIFLIKENRFTFQKTRSRRYPTETMIGEKDNKI